ncbi:MAG: hypothetical protein IME92_05610 [Proteobacteria bacterium]|nr:hypothetical protein [Pseudomonadota bacterium]
MRLKIYLAAFIFSITLLPLPISAQSKNYTWMVWEQRMVDPQLCREKGICTPQKKFITRLVEEPSEQKAREMLGAIDQLARMRGQPAEHPDTPKICRQTEAGKILGFDPELWDKSDKSAALKDLGGVYFSVQTIKGPKGYSGAFGMDLQNAMETRFRAAGLPVISEEQMENIPGRPQLNVYFSNTKPKTGCRYSVFVSFTQTMLLTRNHTVKLKVGTWGASGGPSGKHPNSNEMGAILRVIDKFLDDYRRANAG